MIVCLDVNIVIYYVERDPVWHPRVVARLTAARAAGDALAVSDAARLECLVGPFRSGDTTVLAEYHAFFADPAIQVLPTTSAVWERAAAIRAAFNFKPMDSIHLATAAEHSCDLFLTNDAQLS